MAALLQAFALGSSLSLAAGQFPVGINTCPGEGRFPPSQSCDNGVFKVCAKLLAAPGSTNAEPWGSKDYFTLTNTNKWLGREKYHHAVSMMRRANGDHACISVWTFAKVSLEIGCDNAPIMCSATDVNSVLSMYKTKGMESASMCLRKICEAQLDALRGKTEEDAEEDGRVVSETLPPPEGGIVVPPYQDTTTTTERVPGGSFGDDADDDDWEQLQFSSISDDHQPKWVAKAERGGGAQGGYNDQMGGGFDDQTGGGFDGQMGGETSGFTSGFTRGEKGGETKWEVASTAQGGDNEINDQMGGGTGSTGGSPMIPLDTTTDPGATPQPLGLHAMPTGLPDQTPMPTPAAWAKLPKEILPPQYTTAMPDDFVLTTTRMPIDVSTTSDFQIS